MSDLFDHPRWPNGPKICVATNLPAFDSRGELDKFRETNCPGSSVIKYWKCNVCDLWHFWATGHDPAGGSSGTTRSAKHMERLERLFFASPIAKTIPRTTLP